MHDYSLPGQDVPAVTQVRPGLLGVPTGSTPTPAPPPPPSSYTRAEPLDVGERYRRETDDEPAWGAPKAPYVASAFHESSLRGYAAPAPSFASDSVPSRRSQWSLPRSDVRSSSGSSSSFDSTPDSGAGEEDEEEMVDVEGDGGLYYAGWRRRAAEPVKEEDEDGIEGDWAGMDMDMD
jgi:hypothetical protein